MNVFLKRYKEAGHDIDPAKISLRQSIRVNTLKIDEKDIVNKLKGRNVKLEKIPFTDNGYFSEAEFSLSSMAEYLQGYFYIQEAASQLPVKVLAPESEDIVLDMCAAPGSKTTQLAQAMENKGSIVALDTSPARLNALKNNIERMGVTNCLVYQKDAQYASDLGVKFDKVLLDAPCSGNFAADEKWFDKRTLEDLPEKVKMQKALLRSAVNVLKPGGVLVYSTCSLELEEDEEVIGWALETLDVELADTGLKMGDEGATENTKLCRKLWPEKTGVQGFFIAKLVKRS